MAIFQRNRSYDDEKRSTGRLSNIKDDLHAATIEFVGTFVFLLLALGGIQSAATIQTEAQTAAANDVATAQVIGSDLEKTMYIAVSMGFSLLISAWLFFRATGSLFNPNISLALLLVGVINPVRFVLYCIAQLAGGIAAAAVVAALTPGPLASNNVLQHGINPAQGVFIEMFITSFLVLSVLMLAAEKHQATPFAPIGIGLTLFAGHMFAAYFTGAAMNTARAFGPAVITGFPSGQHWVFWLGPFLGSFLGAAFYAFLKHFRYWRLQPDQDTTDIYQSPRNPVAVVREKLRSEPEPEATEDRTSKRPEKVV